MTAPGKFLWLVVALEILAAAALGLQRSRRPALPLVDWLTFEEPTARDIQAVEGSVVTGDPASWLDLAQTYRTFGLFPQAEYCFRQVEALHPDDNSYLYHWAICLDLLGRTAEATAKYEEIIAHPPTDATAARTIEYCWLNIGQDRLREEKVPAAEAALRQCLNIAKARLLLARLLTRTGRAAEASTLLDPLLRDGPDLIDANELKSWAEAELGHAEAARDFSERALHSARRPQLYDPTYPAVRARREQFGSLGWMHAAEKLEEKKQLDEARTLYEKALNALWNEDYLLHLARLELTAGHAPRTLQLLQDGAKKVGWNARMRELEGDALHQARREDEARVAWTMAAGFDSSPALENKLAESWSFSRRADLAREHQGLGQFELGKIEFLRNALDLARPHFEQAAALNPMHAHSWFYLAETERYLGHADAARTAYDHCLQLDPDHGRALRGRARLP